MEELLQTYGYLAAYIGTLIEGEVALLSTVISAKLGYMNFYLALFAAFLGAYTRDILTFWLGRKSGKASIEKKPAFKKKIAKVTNMMEKHPIRTLSFYRLLYGLVTLIVLMAGISDISFKKFAFLAAFSNLFWVCLLGGLGYVSAEAMMRNLEVMSDYKGYILGGLAVVGIAYWLWKRMSPNTPEMEEVISDK